MAGRILSSATIFLSAFLLFQVQPVIAKYILPWFGSSLGVWTTCLLFFQVLLLGGYAYAHFVVSRLTPKRQAILHAVLLGLALFTLPITPSTDWKPTGAEAPVGRILLVLAFSVGLPYILLSSTGPLIQGWFARLHPGRSPYRLYALSNVGSLLALLSYPFVVEPALRLQQQTTIWSVGYAVFALACAGCAWQLARGAPLVPQRDASDLVQHSEAPPEDDPAAPTWRDGLAWFLLAACASALLLATTNQMCLDIAVIPFLWIVPLSLYLISFILTFDHQRWYARPVFCGLMPFALLLAFARLRDGVDAPIEQQVAAYSVALFVCCMCCHGELSRSKPAPRHLTWFFLIVSLGGAAGGLLIAVGAPNWLGDFHEFPLLLALCYAIVLAVVVRRTAQERAPFPGTPWLQAAWAVTWLGCLVGIVYVSLRLLGEPFWLHESTKLGTKEALRDWLGDLRAVAWIAPGIVLAVVEALRWQQHATLKAWWFAPRRLVVLAGTLVGCMGLFAVIGAAGWQIRDRGESVIERGRNFYGVLTILEYFPGGEWHDWTLRHGRIMHGYQFRQRATWPTSYYGPESGAGLAVRLHPDLEVQERSFRIGVVGLGTGTMAAYANQRMDPAESDDDKYVEPRERQPGDYVRFYEINPLVEDWAWNRFTFLEEARQRGADVGVYLGDARIVMERQIDEGMPESFDVLAIDAFSSDAIPIHLLTRESLEIYWKHLRADGVLALHVTNRYINLKPIVRRLAHELHKDLVRVKTEDDPLRGIDSCEWLLMTTNQRLLDRVNANGSVEEFAIGEPDSWPLWTDDFSSVYEVLKFVEERENEGTDPDDEPKARRTWLQWCVDLFRVEDEADQEQD